MREEARAQASATAARRVPLPQALAAAWVEVGASATGPGAPGFALSSGGRANAIEAYGEVLRSESVDLRELLRLELRWSGAPIAAPGPWLGALAFDVERGPGVDFRGFAPSRWVVPELLLWSEGGRRFAAAFALPTEPAQLLAERLARVRSCPVSREPAPPHARRLPAPFAKERWGRLVERALAAVGAGTLDKVVLARAIDVAASQPLDPRALTAALHARYPTCRAFLLRGDDGSAFLGASPETFCSIEGTRLRADALAGSARPGDAQALLGNAKDLREHGWVVDHLRSGLAALSTAIDAPRAPGLRELANVVHLHTPVAAQLKPLASVADVVAALHPTPAVGGVPVRAALQFLADHEELDRGLYAGLVGWVGPHGAELCVALRCALVRGKGARIFVGAGVVQGSTADAEWAETELKARALLDALGVGEETGA